MLLKESQFEELKPYLIYDKKLSGNHHNLQVYQSRFRIMCRYFGEREFNRANFTEFMGYLKEKGYTNNYINNFIKLAKHIDKYYKLNEIQDYTYFEKTKKFIDYLTPTQIQQMIAADIEYRTDTERKNARNKILLEVLFLTGARVSEVLNLRWDDIYDGNPPYLIINQTKTSLTRFAPISKELYYAICHLAHFGGFIFSNELGHHIDAETVSVDIKRRAGAIGFEGRVYPHLIRHSFVNFMLRSGTPIDIVSDLVGHKNIQTTYEHYIHIRLEELATALHIHHPYFKRQQNLDFLLEKGKDLLTRLIDTERFIIQTKHGENHVTFHVKEIEKDYD